MAEKDDGLGLGLSLRWGENDDNNMNEQQQHPFNMHKPPQPVPNQRASSFNNLFHLHGKVSFFSIHFFMLLTCSLFHGF